MVFLCSRNLALLFLSLIAVFPSSHAYDVTPANMLCIEGCSSMLSMSIIYNHGQVWEAFNSTCLRHQKLSPTRMERCKHGFDMGENIACMRACGNIARSAGISSDFACVKVENQFWDVCSEGFNEAVESTINLVSLLQYSGPTHMEEPQSDTSSVHDADSVEGLKRPLLDMQNEDDMGIFRQRVRQWKAELIIRSKGGLPEEVNATSVEMWESADELQASNSTLGRDAYLAQVQAEKRTLNEIAERRKRSEEEAFKEIEEELSKKGTQKLEDSKKTARQRTQDRAGGKRLEAQKKAEVEGAKKAQRIERAKFWADEEETRMREHMGVSAREEAPVRHVGLTVEQLESAKEVHAIDLDGIKTQKVTVDASGDTGGKYNQRVVIGKAQVLGQDHEGSLLSSADGSHSSKGGALENVAQKNQLHAKESGVDNERESINNDSEKIKPMDEVLDASPVSEKALKAEEPDVVNVDILPHETKTNAEVVVEVDSEIASISNKSKSVPPEFLSENVNNNQTERQIGHATAASEEGTRPRDMVATTNPVVKKKMLVKPKVQGTLKPKKGGVKPKTVLKSKKDKEPRLQTDESLASQPQNPPDSSTENRKSAPTVPLGNAMDDSSQQPSPSGPSNGLAGETLSWKEAGHIEKEEQGWLEEEKERQKRFGEDIKKEEEHRMEKEGIDEIAISSNEPEVYGVVYSLDLDEPHKVKRFVHLEKGEDMNTDNVANTECERLATLLQLSAKQVQKCVSKSKKGLDRQIKNGRFLKLVGARPEFNAQILMEDKRKVTLTVNIGESNAEVAGKFCGSQSDMPSPACHAIVKEVLTSARGE